MLTTPTNTQTREVLWCSVCIQNREVTLGAVSVDSEYKY